MIVHDGPGGSAVSGLANSFQSQYLEGARKGVVSAYNLGLKESKGDVVAFTDDDAVPKPDWIERLVRAYSPGVGGVGGAVRPLESERPPLTSTTINEDGRTNGWLRI